MSEQEMIDLFDRWERVWHGGEFGLAASCVGEEYTRHDESGDRVVTGAAYAEELAALRAARPDIRVVVYDHVFIGTRAWFRFAFTWTEVSSGAAMSRAGLQTYRTEGGRLVETWISMQPLGTTWADMPQARWTSPPGIG